MRKVQVNETVQETMTILFLKDFRSRTDEDAKGVFDICDFSDFNA